MGWSRETRGLSQGKLKKPTIKKNLPLPKDGDNGDISIRNVSAGVFSFFKALGTWFKLFNDKNHMIPDKPNTYDIGSQHRPWRSLYLSNNSLHMGNTKAEKTSISTDGTDLNFKNKAGTESKIVGRKAGTAGAADADVIDSVVTIGEDDVENKHGWLALGSGLSKNGGIIAGTTNVADAAVMGLRVVNTNSVGTAMQVVLSAKSVTSLSAANAGVQLCTFNGSSGAITLDTDASVVPTGLANTGTLYSGASDLPWWKAGTGTQYQMLTTVLDKNTSGDDAEDVSAFHIDFDRTIATSGTAAHNDIGINLDVNSYSLGTSTLKGMDIDVVGGPAGTSTATGIDLNVGPADTNIGINIVTAGTHLKLVSMLDADDYATLSVANTGDLTIATVGDGSTDSDLTLDADGDIKLEAAGGNVNADAPIEITSTSPQLNLKYDGTSYARFTVASTGTTTLLTAGSGTTDSDLILNADGDIVLDSANGIFIAKNNGTEFSAANSSYAGMILGYTDVGLNATLATYNLTTSYAVPTSHFSVTFVVPPSENVEIFIQVACSIGSSNVGDVYAGLSDNSTYNAIASFHEVEIFDSMSRGAWRTLTHTWTLGSALLPAVGTSETIWVGFKSTSTTGTPLLSWGGDATNLSPDFIMKATALPATIGS